MSLKPKWILPLSLFVATLLLGGCESFEWEGVSVEEEKVSDTVQPEADPLKSHNDRLVKDGALERN